MIKKKVASVLGTLVVATAISLVAVQPASAATAYCDAHMYDNNQSLTGLPNQSLQCQMQQGPAQGWGTNSFVYTGPVNGVMGTNSWKGVMAFLKAEWGYTGPVNGIPGPNTYNAMIRAGNLTGWNGTRAQDGSLDQADWQNWAYYVRTDFFGA